MKGFSDDHDWSFRESLGGNVDGYAALEVSVCTEPGIAFSALQPMPIQLPCLRPQAVNLHRTCR
jgi:hypothetical protein